MEAYFTGYYPGDIVRVKPNCGLDVSKNYFVQVVTHQMGGNDPKTLLKLEDHEVDSRNVVMVTPHSKNR